MTKHEFSNLSPLAFIDKRSNHLFVINNAFYAHRLGIEVIHHSQTGKTGLLRLPGWAKVITAYRSDRHGNLIAPAKGVENLDWINLGENSEGEIDGLAVDQSLYLRVRSNRVRFYGGYDRIPPAFDDEIRSHTFWLLISGAVRHWEIDTSREGAWLIRQARTALEPQLLEEINPVLTRMRVYRYRATIVRVNARNQPRWCGADTGDYSLIHLQEAGCPMDIHNGWIDYPSGSVIVREPEETVIYSLQHPEGRRIPAILPVTRAVLGSNAPIITWAELSNGFCKAGVEEVLAACGYDQTMNLSASEIPELIKKLKLFAKNNFEAEINQAIERLAGKTQILPDQGV